MLERMYQVFISQFLNTDYIDVNHLKTKQNKTKNFKWSLHLILVIENTDISSHFQNLLPPRIIK